MLGQRLGRLKREGIISAELLDLIDAAKAFGNEAAHGDDLEKIDAAIARDLCEAFLRQAFSVPFLLRRAKKREEARKLQKMKLKTGLGS